MVVRQWPISRWITVIVGATTSALVIGIPTGIVGTPWYTRMTPVLWWNYPIWIVTALLSGLLLATYVRSPAATGLPSRAGVGGNALSLLAVGCPVCNKLVVMAVGVSGAMTLWAPIQPILAVSALVLLAWAVWIRIDTEQRCPVPPRREQPAGASPGIDGPTAS